MRIQEHRPARYGLIDQRKPETPLGLALCGVPKLKPIFPDWELELAEEAELIAWTGTQGTVMPPKVSVSVNTTPLSQYPLL
jgi:hypothetical protein